MLYRYGCKEGHEISVICEPGKRPAYKRCKCGGRAVQLLPRGVMAGAFKPYVEEHMTGQPIEITSRAQRDALCKQHGVSYDSVKYAPSRQSKTAVEDLDFGVVKESLQRGRTPDGEAIISPVKLSNSEKRKYKEI